MSPHAKPPPPARGLPGVLVQPEAPGPTEVVDALPWAILVADSAGHVRFRNAPSRSLLGVTDNLPALFGHATLIEPRETPSSAVGTDVWRRLVEPAIRHRATIAFQCVLAPGRDMLGVRISPMPRGDILVVLEPIAAGPSADSGQEMSRRLASLGKLAARVAHELNNPLDGILRYINLALRIVGDAPEPKLKAYLSETRTGLMRMVQIIGDLLEYSRSTAGEFDDVGINEVIEEAIRTLAAAADERKIVVAADFQSSTMPKVRGSRLYQVLCNLIRNAIDAMPGGGRLTISSGVVADDVVIRVADTGAGLLQPVEKVFEPFYTTKPPGQGTGLGLAISRDFVEDMGGTITAGNGESGGAVFTVRLPRGESRTGLTKHRPARGIRSRGCEP
jgi:signal transduction histidine kinase